MPILFSTVSQGVVVLAKHATCSGNFLEVTEQVLGKIRTPNEKLTYAHGKYLFHYISEDRIVYLCITDDDFERSKAFAFLSEIKRRFQLQYGARAQSALPYAMNTEFSRILATQMAYHSRDRDRIAEAENDLDELKGIMVKNIASVAERGEKLELLIDKTEDLSSHSMTFKTSSRALANKLWWRNVKMTIAIVVVVLVILVFIVSAACKTFDWSKCGKK
ncbi:vesicle-associated membrane protein 7-like [Watersipora subatra]|uniref:vesicle-associated membrane protein 7-like n=1 Tax=Watersipora subatra TaxID=2589382 RepID=UPI00355B5FDA